MLGRRCLALGLLVASACSSKSDTSTAPRDAQPAPVHDAEPTAETVPSDATPEGPQEVHGLRDAVDIDCGSQHCCAVRGDGAVVCWGNNEYGQLGNGSTETSSVPVEVVGVADAVRVSCGHHSCAVTKSGRVYCWGPNKYRPSGGRRSVGSYKPQLRVVTQPVQIPGIEDATQLATGQWQTCALRRAGQVVCWDRLWQTLDEPTPFFDRAPAAVAVAVGGFKTCALYKGGRVRCRVAMGSEVEDPGIHDARSISLSFWGHACVVTKRGRVRCWGGNEYGQLGNGRQERFRRRPVRVLDVSGAADVITGGAFSCARLDSGALTCWGEAPDPAVLGSTDDIAKVVAGGNVLCALRDDGTVRCSRGLP